MQEFEITVPNSPSQILSYLIPILVEGLWTLDLHLFKLLTKLKPRVALALVLSLTR